MAVIDTCPNCGGELELSFAVWMKDVKLDTHVPDEDAREWADATLVDFAPSRSADNPDTGFNFDEDPGAGCNCIDCGRRFLLYLPSREAIGRRWHYTAPGRPSYEDLLAIVEDVAMGNAEYDTLSEIAARVLDGKQADPEVNA